MSEGFKDYVEQRAMTDHAQRFRGCTDHQCIYLEGKPRQGMGTNGGCRCDPRPLLRDMQQRITQAHAAGRREAFQEVITRQTEVIRARETLMGLVAAPTMIEQAKVRNEECSTVRDWCAKAKEAGQ